MYPICSNPVGLSTVGRGTVSRPGARVVPRWPALRVHDQVASLAEVERNGLPAGHNRTP